MSSKYAKKYKIPDELEGIVDRFAREVLRYQPQDILQFAIDYFKGLEENQNMNDFHKKEENYMSDEKPHDDKELDLVQEKEKNEFEPDENDLVITIEGGRHKKIYSDWFLKHSIDKPIIISNNEEGETRDENLKRIQIGYELWFNKHCVKGSNKVQNGEIEKVEDSKAIDGNREETKNSKDEYSDWFNRHSNDKIKIKYIPEKTEYQENNRYEIDYNSWFTNHSK